MIYTIDEYAAEFFDGVKSKMAKRWSVRPQQVTDWRKAEMFFIVDGDTHTRCTPVNDIDYGRKEGE